MQLEKKAKVNYDGSSSSIKEYILCKNGSCLFNLRTTLFSIYMFGEFFLHGVFCSFDAIYSLKHLEISKSY